MTPEKSDQDRGIHYADGGVSYGSVCYPDPERMAKINKEWADADVHVSPE